MTRPLNLFNSHRTLDPNGGYPRNVSFPFNYSVHYLGQCKSGETFRRVVCAPANEKRLRRLQTRWLL